jgi:hypothetical protein
MHQNSFALARIEENGALIGFDRKAQAVFTF